MVTAPDLTCQELVELVSDYLEGTLPMPDRRRFEAHLAICKNCTVYLDQMRQTIALVGRLTDDDIPAEGRDRLVTAFRGWHRR